MKSLVGEENDGLQAYPAVPQLQAIMVATGYDGPPKH